VILLDAVDRRRVDQVCWQHHLRGAHDLLHLACRRSTTGFGVAAGAAARAYR
jgi:hypothetical protein